MAMMKGRLRLSFGERIMDLLAKMSSRRSFDDSRCIIDVELVLFMLKYIFNEASRKLNLIELHESRVVDNLKVFSSPQSCAQQKISSICASRHSRKLYGLKAVKERHLCKVSFVLNGTDIVVI